MHISILFRSMPFTWPKQCTKRFSTLVRIHDWVSMTNSKNSLPAPSPNGSPVTYLDEKWERYWLLLLLSGAQATPASYKQWKIRADASILASDPVLEQTSSPADSEYFNRVCIPKKGWPTLPFKSIKRFADWKKNSKPWVALLALRQFDLQWLKHRISHLEK